MIKASNAAIAFFTGMVAAAHPLVGIPLLIMSTIAIHKDEANRIENIMKNPDVVNTVLRAERYRRKREELKKRK